MSKARLKNAFDKLNILAAELQIGRYSDRCDELQQNYRYMLQYYVEGVDDPQRRVVYNRLVSRLYVLACDLREELMFRNATSFEYMQKRYFPHKLRFSNYNDLFDALAYFHRQSELLVENTTSDKAEFRRIRSNFEKLLPDVFSIFWLSTRYEQEEKMLFTRIHEASYKGVTEKSLSVSALTLNLWRMFDEHKLMLLLDACESDVPQVRQRALTGLCFIIVRYNDFVTYFPAIRNRLVLLADDQHFSQQAGNIMVQIVATMETDKISRKMREEILPEVMKISPLLKDRMDAEKLMDSDEWEEGNPDWQELLDASGVSDKLQELSELQQEGADVYMSTFSLLKSFTFFNEVSNWFIPFESVHTSVSELFETSDKGLISAFTANNAMCNSDKYSFCLSILQMPEMQRNMLKSNFKVEAEQLEEMARDEALLTPDLAGKTISKQYVQDLFRFFKLHPQKDSFTDFFDSSLKMHNTFLFATIASGNSIKSGLADFYLSKSHYSEAIELYSDLLDETEPTAAIYQKMGYALQQLSQLGNALEAYKRADIIQPDDLWTVRKIALCYRLLADYENALHYYRHASYLDPENENIQMNVGNCLQELKKYDEALAVFYKVDALNENNQKVWKAISWCAFLASNLSKAAYYNYKLIEQQPDKHDLLNAGHIAWCSRKVKDAMVYYKMAHEHYQFNTGLFLSAIEQDKMHLIANGIANDEYSLMIDELLYSF
ncbi:MAG: hypothetical protein JXR27_05130 [Paludibacteraceae bacterium]|nr:hypothetical protein [Paludibacteraceae bacterium]